MKELTEKEQKTINHLHQLITNLIKDHRTAIDDFKKQQLENKQDPEILEEQTVVITIILDFLEKLNELTFPKSGFDMYVANHKIIHLITLSLSPQKMGMIESILNAMSVFDDFINQKNMEKETNNLPDGFKNLQ